MWDRRIKKEKNQLKVMPCDDLKHIKESTFNNVEDIIEELPDFPDDLKLEQKRLNKNLRNQLKDIYERQVPGYQFKAVKEAGIFNTSYRKGTNYFFIYDQKKNLDLGEILYDTGHEGYRNEVVTVLIQDGHFYWSHGAVTSHKPEAVDFKPLDPDASIDDLKNILTGEANLAIITRIEILKSEIRTKTKTGFWDCHINRKEEKISVLKMLQEKMISNPLASIQTHLSALEKEAPKLYKSLYAGLLRQDTKKLCESLEELRKSDLQIASSQEKDFEYGKGMTF